MAVLPSRIAFFEPAGIVVQARLLATDPALGLFAQSDAAMRLSASYLKALAQVPRDKPPRLVASLRWHTMNPRSMEMLLAFTEMTEVEAQVRSGLLPCDEHSALLPQTATGLRALIVSSDGKLIVQRQGTHWLPGVAKTLISREVESGTVLMQTCAHMVQYATQAPMLVHSQRLLRVLALIVWDHLQRWELIYTCDLRKLDVPYPAHVILAALKARGLHDFEALELEYLSRALPACTSTALASVLEQSFALPSNLGLADPR
jgi:hypothetical protein